jgi:hypothetical protein
MSNEAVVIDSNISGKIERNLTSQLFINSKKEKMLIRIDGCIKCKGSISLKDINEDRENLINKFEESINDFLCTQDEDDLINLDVVSEHFDYFLVTFNELVPDKEIPNLILSLNFNDVMDAIYCLLLNGSHDDFSFKR